MNPGVLVAPYPKACVGEPAQHLRSAQCKNEGLLVLPTGRQAVGGRFVAPVVSRSSLGHTCLRQASSGRVQLRPPRNHLADAGAEVEAATGAARSISGVIAIFRRTQVSW